MSSTDKQQSSSTNSKFSEISSEARLYLYNSFTNSQDKDEFFQPIDTKQVKSYHCDTIIRDERDVGHARSYISLDIIRRVLEDYFTYNVHYCMNVTDIDDKHVKDLRSCELNEDQKIIYDKKIIKAENSIQNLDKSSHIETNKRKLFDGCDEILYLYLDPNYSHSTNPVNNEIFLQLAHHYGTKFFNDMKNLDIKFPNVITHMSQYVPMVIRFIEKLIENGYAFKSGSSVYFDARKFHQQHTYAKAEPDRIDDVGELNKDEVKLTTEENKNKDKNKACDFLLWQEGKSGEPVWNSPWSLGQPGSDIGCGVRAGGQSSSQFDIHSGDIDSKFIDHYNEIAQSKDIDPWFYYFHRSCHLTIAGCEASKSLENVVNIQQAIEKYSSRQLRLSCLLHSWSSTLDYSDDGMEKAIVYEKMLNDFFLGIKTRLGLMIPFDDSNAHTKFDEQLNEFFSIKKNEIHLALCDCIDTPLVLENIRQLISTTQIYMNTIDSTVNHRLLKDIAAYIPYLINIFGLNYSVSDADDIGFTRSTENQTSTINVEDITMPYVGTFSLCHDAVGTEATVIRNKEIVPIGYIITTDIVPELDIRIEDQGDTDKAVLKRAREQDLVVEKNNKKKNNN